MYIFYYMLERLYSLPRESNSSTKNLIQANGLSTEENQSGKNIMLNISLEDLIFICKILQCSDSKFKHKALLYRLNNNWWVFRILNFFKTGKKGNELTIDLIYVLLWLENCFRIRSWNVLIKYRKWTNAWVLHPEKIHQIHQPDLSLNKQIIGRCFTFEFLQLISRILYTYLQIVTQCISGYFY